MLPQCSCEQYSHFEVCSKDYRIEALTDVNAPKEQSRNRIRDVLLVKYIAPGVRACEFVCSERAT